MSGKQKIIKQLYLSDMNEDQIKNAIKNHLKVDVKFRHAVAFCDGFIKVSLYWDNELISEKEEKVVKNFF